MSITMKTYKGHTINYTLHTVSEVDIEDIAHSLSRQNRFLGHTEMPYTVAQHSILVSKQVPPDHALAGLLHDAAEAYFGDIIRPVKELMGREFRRMHDNFTRLVFEAYSVTFPIPQAVHEADHRLLVTEMHDPRIYGKPEVTPIRAEGYKPYDMEIFPYASASEAEFRFITHFRELTFSNG